MFVNDSGFWKRFQVATSFVLVVVMYYVLTHLHLLDDKDNAYMLETTVLFLIGWVLGRYSDKIGLSKSRPSKKRIWRVIFELLYSFGTIFTATFFVRAGEILIFGINVLFLIAVCYSISKTGSRHFSPSTYISKGDRY